MYSEKYETTVNHFYIPYGVKESANPVKATIYYNPECPLCGVKFGTPYINEDGVLVMKCDAVSGHTVFISYVIKYSDGTEKLRDLVGVADENNNIDLLMINPRRTPPYVTDVEAYINDEAPEEEH